MHWESFLLHIVLNSFLFQRILSRLEIPETRSLHVAPKFITDFLFLGKEWIPFYLIQHRKPTTSNLGQTVQKWAHQEDNRQWHTVVGARDHGYQCRDTACDVKLLPIFTKYPFNFLGVDHIHYMSFRFEADSGDKVTVPRHDYEKLEKVLFFWSSGAKFFCLLPV